ncbi:MAG: exo-beta-N-acetylmuramidase NamZ domain-containing protein [bacterium]
MVNKLWYALLLILVLNVSSPNAAEYPAKSKVKLGVDVLLEKHLDSLKGKRVGLITNPSGVNRQLVSTIDILASQTTFKLVALFGLEHGIRGDLFAGQSVTTYIDERTGLTVYSLYGKTRRPTAEMLKDVDVIVYDIQDIGSRTYTFISSMIESMKAATTFNKEVMVLDRPNPCGGLLFEGPILERNRFSMVGIGAIPVTHGMTAGEFARYFNTEEKINCKLTVIPMEGWTREMLWDDTGLEWVQTSPHIPHAMNAILYTATGMLGGVGTEINEGVGYTLPFETIAAEWITNPEELANKFNSLNLPGVYFRPITYRPYYFKFKDKVLNGVQLHVYNWHTFLPLETAIQMLANLNTMYPDKLKFGKSLETYWGNKLRGQLEQKMTAEQITATWKPGLDDFAKKRAKYLMY